MKKSNVVIIALLAICSAILLWAWYALGFSKIDSPLDLIVCIAWWVVIAGVVAGIASAEAKRRDAVRTVFVAPTGVFNSERGLAIVDSDPVEAVQQTLEGLSYNFRKESLPQSADNFFTHVVKSHTFKNGSQTQSGEREYDWQGEVFTLKTGETRQFRNKEELQAILGVQ